MTFTFLSTELLEYRVFLTAFLTSKYYTISY